VPESFSSKKINKRRKKPKEIVLEGGEKVSNRTKANFPRKNEPGLL